MARRKRVWFGFLVLCVLIGFAMALSNLRLAPVTWGWYGPINTSDGIAMKGYDPVSYHLFGQAFQGSESFSLTWKNVKWHFSSDENRVLFESDPERYAPQLGGYCAKTLTWGLTLDADPNSWTIQDEKLYLFLSNEYRDDFMVNVKNGIIDKAQASWKQRPSKH